MHPMLNTAVKAARRAGTIINRGARDIDIVAISKKQHNDFVTEIDKAAEVAVIDTLLEAYPDHAILAEESGHTKSKGGGSEYQWIIDPLDGTTNFIHGFPHYNVSIGLAHKGIMTQAVVYNPTNNELFTASRGRGAFLNDRRLRVSKRTRLEEGLIGTGFPFREKHDFDAYMKQFAAMTKACSGVRRPGAAALDLAYVAAGRLDGFWEVGLSPWDMAAGTLLVTEAGGLVGDLDGNEGYMESGRVIAASPKIFAQIVATLRG